MIWFIINIIILSAGLAGLYYFFRYKNSLLKNEEQRAIEDVTSFVKKLDEDASVALNEIILKNSVVFECPCKHNQIRTFIDLSKEENTFTCPECKNEYKIDITMIPILKGKIIDEHHLYDLISDIKHEENIKNDKNIN